VTLVDVDLFIAELDELVQREHGFRLVRAGRLDGVEEFVIGSCPGPMLMFELPVADEEGMSTDETIALALACREARLKLAAYVGQEVPV
jgi:hypothetical protein